MLRLAQTCLCWEEGGVLEVLDECAGEESAKEEDHGEEEDVRHILTRVGEDAHKPVEKMSKRNCVEEKTKILTVCNA